MSKPKMPITPALKRSILAEMKKDGTADKIAEKWLGSGADLDKSDAK